MQRRQGAKMMVRHALILCAFALHTLGRLAMTLTEESMRTPSELYAELERIAEHTKTLGRLLTTKAKIGQTPKELIWTLNKAKLYRYAPVAPEAQRHRIPLLLVFAIMNRPHVLDLRPGHSFVEYMLKRDYDIYLLDWGIPGPEDKHL